MVSGLPPTVAVIPTEPATVLVNVMTASPLASVVTTFVPTKFPVPLAILKVTAILGSTFPLASVMCAFTLLVAEPLATAPVVTTLNVLTVKSGTSGIKTTCAGLPNMIDKPPTFAVMFAIPAM